MAAARGLRDFISIQVGTLDASVASALEENEALQRLLALYNGCDDDQERAEAEECLVDAIFDILADVEENLQVLARPQVEGPVREQAAVLPRQRLDQLGNAINAQAAVALSRRSSRA